MKLKPTIHALTVLPGEDYPGRTEQSYLHTRLKAYRDTLPAGPRGDWFTNPNVSVFERAHKAGISLSRHR